MKDTAHPHDPFPRGTAPVAASSSEWASGVDPRRLLVFRAVGREGSFAAAARTLGWTQPAVSQHIHRLEREIGMPLVARAGRGITLTDPGRILLSHAEAVAAALQAADKALAHLAGLEGGRVRIAAFPSASATLVARAIGGLRTRHPEVDVHLTQLEPPEAEELLLSGDCEIALVFDYDEASADREAFDTTPLLEDPLRVVLASDHPLGAGAGGTDSDPVSLDALRDERWVAGCPRCRGHLVASAASAGFEPAVSHSTDDYVVVQALVATGTAVAVLPALALTASRNPAVQAREIAGHAPRHVRALTLPGARRVPAIAAALSHLRSVAREIESVLTNDPVH